MFNRVLLSVALVASSLGGGVASAAATNDALVPYISGGAIYTYRDEEARLSDDGAGGFVTAGYPFNRNFALELGVSAQDFDDDNPPDSNKWDEVGAELNALLTFPFGRGWIPYFSAGIGATESDLQGGEAPTSMHYVVGGGTFKFFSLKSFDIGLRADIRYRLIDFDQNLSGDDNTAFDDRFDEGQVRFGVVVPFGRVIRGDIDRTTIIRETTTNTVYVGEKDSDGDGVIDSRDKCPDTPKGTVVDGSGCPDKNFIKELGSVYFQTDSDVLTADAKSTLNAIAVEAASMKSTKPRFMVEVDGNADRRGSDEYNMSLSARRAKAVADYLTTKGISNTRIKVVASGEQNPVAGGESASALAKNRRVDVKAYEQ